MKASHPSDFLYRVDFPSNISPPPLWIFFLSPDTFPYFPGFFFKTQGTKTKVLGLFLALPAGRPSLPYPFESHGTDPDSITFPSLTLRNAPPTSLFFTIPPSPALFVFPLLESSL